LNADHISVLLLQYYVLMLSIRNRNTGGGSFILSARR